MEIRIRLERAFSHLHEGIMHRVFLTTTQGGVLEDVADTCVVFTGSTEGNTVYNDENTTHLKVLSVSAQSKCT